jgi:uncharacterized protein YndB with AHSA1/START domain
VKKIDNYEINDTLDLVLDREVDVPPELVWEAWTDPEGMKEWFCPKPWGVSECRLDVRPGGEMYFVMRSPSGDEFPNLGCYLETVENRKLVWTSALKPGYRPVEAPAENDLLFTAVILLEPTQKGTRYIALAIHQNPKGKAQHEAMGFHEGWSTVLDQLVEHIKQKR